MAKRPVVGSNLDQEDLALRVELWNVSPEKIERTLVAAVDAELARAAYDVAARRYPPDKNVLIRQGIRVLRDRAKETVPVMATRDVED